MNKKTILFIGLIVCFLGVIVIILAYVGTLEKQKIANQKEIINPVPSASSSFSAGSVNKLPVASRNNTGTIEEYKEYKKGPLDELSIEGENSLIPLVSLEEWKVSGPFDNPEYCEDNKFFRDRRPAYCSLAGLKDSYSVFWKKDIQSKEKSFMPGTIVASAFDFSDASSVAIEDVVSAHKIHLRFLENFELQGITIQRQEFKYGIRLVSQEEAEKLSEQEIAEQTVRIVLYFDIFALDNVVFTISYDSDYEDEAKIIEKAIIEKNK